MYPGPPAYEGNPNPTDQKDSQYPPQQPYAPQQGYPAQQGYPPQAGYQPQPGYPPPQGHTYQPQGQYYPQQPGGVVVVTQGPQSRGVSQSYCGHIAFACVVFWCFGCLCGLIAFILAMIASDRASSGHHNEASQLGKASLGVSIAGIIVFVIIVGITIGLYMSNKSTYDSSSYSSSCMRYCKDWTGSYATRACSSCVN